MQMGEVTALMQGHSRQLAKFGASSDKCKQAVSYHLSNDAENCNNDVPK